MSTFETGGVLLHYEDHGSGPALLLLAPGGLDSTIEFWGRAAINPLQAFADGFRLVAMDQRNAGGSTGPFPAGAAWDAYAGDQLGLMDHLGIGRFLVMGCCIGCSYALKLATVAPERVVAAVLEQPIGLTEHNAEHWRERSGDFLARLRAARPELEEASARRSLADLLAPTGFVGSVTRDEVARCRVPLAVLPGTDAIHPAETGREVGRLAPGAVVIDPWKDPEHLAEATAAVRAFLVERAAVLV